MVLLPFFLLQAVIAVCQRFSHYCLPEVQSTLLVTNLGKEHILYESQKATVLLQDTGSGYQCMNMSYRYPFDMLLNTVVLCIDQLSPRHGLGTVQEKSMYHDQKQYGYLHCFWERDLTLRTGGVLFHLASEPKIRLPELFSNTEEAKLNS